MNGWLTRIALLLAILPFTAPADAEHLDHGKGSKMNESKIKSVQFRDIGTDDRSNGDIAAFSAILIVAGAQPASNGGINLDLSLKYQGTHKVEIHNPLYFIQYHLTGSDKTQRFDNKKPPIPLVHRQGKIDPATDFSFQILAITKNGQNLDTPEQVNAPTVAFTQGDDQKYFLQISKFTDEKTQRAEELPEGEYHLEIAFSIVNAGISSKTIETPESRTLKAQEIM